MKRRKTGGDDIAMKLENAAEDRARGARLDYVDIAKGMMILAVVFSHAWFANSDILGDWLPFSMPLFFFLSGYTFRPGRSYGANLGRRVVSLLFPYFIFCAVCNLFFPVYAGLVKRISMMSFAYLPKKAALWLAVLKVDPLGMLMSTPMWFLAALFTASILFFALAERTRESLWKTLAAVAVLVAAAIAIDLVKKGQLPWFVDLAPYAAARRRRRARLMTLSARVVDTPKAFPTSRRVAGTPVPMPKRISTIARSRSGRVARRRCAYSRRDAASAASDGSAAPSSGMRSSMVASPSSPNGASRETRA